MQALVTSLEHLERRLASGDAQVCVIGLGTVGLPQLLAAAEAGFHLRRLGPFGSCVACRLVACGRNRRGLCAHCPPVS